MRIITKRWIQVFHEVQRELDSGEKSAATDAKIAWLEDMANKVQKAYEEESKINDFAERNCRIYCNGTSIIIDVEDMDEIIVENAMVMEDEIDISSLSDDVLIKAWEIYPIEGRMQELHLMLEKDGVEFYFTVVGRVVQR